LALRRLIAGGVAPDKLMAAAVDVRDARVRALRARRATIVPKDDAYVQYARIDTKIQEILETSPLDILAEFGCQIEDADARGNGH
jgi:hypothetical protein